MIFRDRGVRNAQSRQGASGEDLCSVVGELEVIRRL